MRAEFYFKAPETRRLFNRPAHLGDLVVVADEPAVDEGGDGDGRQRLGVAEDDLERGKKKARSSVWCSITDDELHCRLCHHSCSRPD